MQDSGRCDSSTCMFLLNFIASLGEVLAVAASVAAGFALLTAAVLFCMTGDFSNLLFWILFFLIALFVSFLMVIKSVALAALSKGGNIGSRFQGIVSMIIGLLFIIWGALAGFTLVHVAPIIGFIVASFLFFKDVPNKLVDGFTGDKE